MKLGGKSSRGKLIIGACIPYPGNSTNNLNANWTCLFFSIIHQGWRISRYSWLVQRINPLLQYSMVFSPMASKHCYCVVSTYSKVCSWSARQNYSFQVGPGWDQCTQELPQDFEKKFQANVCLWVVWMTLEPFLMKPIERYSLNSH